MLAQRLQQGLGVLRVEEHRLAADLHARGQGPQVGVLIDGAEADFTSQVLGGAVKECELVAKGLEAGSERGFAERVSTVEPREDGASLRTRRIQGGPGREPIGGARARIVLCRRLRGWSGNGRLAGSPQAPCAR